MRLTIIHLSFIKGTADTIEEPTIMFDSRCSKSEHQKSLRLLPGVIIVSLQWLIRFAVPAVIPGASVIGVAGAVLGGLALLLWWAFFSRAKGLDRLIAVVLIIGSLAATPLILHESLAKAGQGVLFYVYALPLLCLVFVGWAAVSRNLPATSRRATMVAAIFLACGVWAFVRTGGITSELESEFAWRWSITHEEELLSQSWDTPKPLPSDQVPAVFEASWPGFRGPGRDSVIHGIRIRADWVSSPPIEMWRRPVGPGWSSFAVAGNLFYTQEQRGDEEAVSCYRVSSGEPVWRHLDKARFWESNGGAGPRGTPSFREGRVYAFGATGILNVLDAVDGSVLWSRDVAADTKTDVPTWGFASSPLLLEDRVIVAAAGSLAAYDLASGEPRWVNPAGGDCYSSPHLLIVNGTRQILLQKESGVIAVDPEEGRILWEYPWPGNPIVQPALVPGGDILISVGERSGIRRISVARGPEGWTVSERWLSSRIKPYFNDSVIHEGQVFGFDGPSLACIDIEDGTRKWRGGRYGRGQIVLLADQDLLLVLTEKGDLALVKAVPDRFAEIARVPAIAGKTWNHPVLSGDILLVRNSREMAAFRVVIEGKGHQTQAGK